MERKLFLTIVRYNPKFVMSEFVISEFVISGVDCICMYIYSVCLHTFSDLKLILKCLMNMHSQHRHEFYLQVVL